MRTRRAGVAAIPVLTLLLAGCGSADPPADCIDATEFGTAIADGANDSPITPVAAAAVQSESSEIYYVAMTFTTATGDEATGVWATNNLEVGRGMTVSVDAVAKEVTDWPDAEAAFGITYPNDGTRAAESCLG